MPFYSYTNRGDIVSLRCRRHSPLRPPLRHLGLEPLERRELLAASVLSTDDDQIGKTAIYSTTSGSLLGFASTGMSGTVAPSSASTTGGSVVAAPLAGTGDPVAPTEYVPAAYAVPSAGTVHTPMTASQLSTLLSGGVLNGHTLHRGDVIQLAAGVTYQGSFEFPDLGAGTDWVYIVSSAAANLPASGTRISDSDIGNMATILSPSAGGLAVGLKFQASYFRFVGIQFLSGAASGVKNYGLFGTGYDGVQTVTEATSVSQLPSNIIIDRCIVRGRGGMERDVWGVSMNAVGMAVLDSVIDRFQDDSPTDTQAIITYMGGSQYLVQNCTLSATGENFMAGGNPMTTGVVPSDFVFRNCYFYKPLYWNDQDPSWDGSDWAIKNLFELKNARRVLVEGCIFQNSWASHRTPGQLGTAIVLTPRNGNRDEGGGIIVSDVEIRTSKIIGANVPLRMLNADDGFKSQPLTRVWFHDNLAYNIRLYTGGLNAGLGDLLWFVGSAKYGTGSDQQASDIRITHNTMVQGPLGHLATYFSIYHEGDYGMYVNTVFQDNIFESPPAGWAVSGTSGPVPSDALALWHVNATFNHNAIFGEGYDVSYPVGNWTGTSTTQGSIGFANYNGLDFRLNPSSQYVSGNPRQASDGLDVGASFNDTPLVANDDSYAINEDTALTVAAAGVLANDTDTNGNPLTAVLITGPSHGTLSLNANGSFTYTPVANYSGPDSFIYQANDGSLNSSMAAVFVNVVSVVPSSSVVVAQSIFYKNSIWDVTNNNLPGFGDDNAIAPDKTAYLPGGGRASFSAVSSYSRGINGVMVDLAGRHGSINANDFIFKVGNNNSPSLWATAIAPTLVMTRVGAGKGNSDRVELTWADNAIQNTWLEVILRGNDALGSSNTNTGLASSHVFYFGSSAGDSGIGDTTGFLVNNVDLYVARRNPSGANNLAAITNRYDYTRDGLVNVTDQQAVRNNSTILSTALSFLNISADRPFFPAIEPVGIVPLTTTADAGNPNRMLSDQGDCGIATSLVSPQLQPPALPIASAPIATSAASADRPLVQPNTNDAVGGTEKVGASLGFESGIETPEVDDELLHLLSQGRSSRES